MKTPFINDPFAIVWLAFKELYPDKECKCFYEPAIRPDTDGGEVYGLTDFDVETGEITVFVKSTLSIEDATEILAHELAHVAVGIEQDHNEVWEHAFDAIFEKYNEIGDKLFSNEKGGAAE